MNCSKCGHFISWHYADGCDAQDCDCNRSFGSRARAPRYAKNPRMTTQVKQVKDAIKALKITRDGEPIKSVKVTKSKYGEFKPITVHADALDPAQIDGLRARLPYVKIDNFPKMEFSIITY